MLKIKREADGTHTANGQPFQPRGNMYRKKTYELALAESHIQEAD